MTYSFFAMAGFFLIDTLSATREFLGFGSNSDASFLQQERKDYKTILSTLPREHHEYIIKKIDGDPKREAHFQKCLNIQKDKCLYKLGVGSFFWKQFLLVYVYMPGNTITLGVQEKEDKFTLLAHDKKLSPNLSAAVLEWHEEVGSKLSLHNKDDAVALLKQSTWFFFTSWGATNICAPGMYSL